MEISDDWWLKPQKVFNSWLSSSLCIRPYQLYGKYGKHVLKQEEFLKANIYFIAELDKIRFILQKTKISRSGIISFSFLIGNNREFSVSTTIPHLIHQNNLPKDFRSLVFGVRDFVHYRKLISHSRFPFTGICLNESSSEEKIILNVYGPETETTMDILPHNVLLITSPNIDICPKILYIGQSKNIQKRTSGHEKIQRALSEVSDRKDIYLYLFGFDVKIYFMSLPANEFEDLNFENPSKLNLKDELSLVEMVLINYFKPKYNELLTKSEIPLSKQVEKLMKKNKYTQIAVDVSFDTNFWKFGSETISNQADHYITYNLVNPFLDSPS